MLTAESTWKKYQVEVPPGKSGPVEVRKFEVDEDGAMIHNLRASIRDGRTIEVGWYTELRRNGSLWMSDTPAEIRDLREPIRRAKGRCLVNGLGLGVVVRGMLIRDEVEHVTVIEIDADVIALVAPHYQEQFGERLTVICADAFEFKPPRKARYDVVWHDIWEDICSDNLEEMTRLHRRYARRCDWQGSWCRNECVRIHRRRGW